MKWKFLTLASAFLTVACGSTDDPLPIAAIANIHRIELQSDSSYVSRNEQIATLQAITLPTHLQLEIRVEGLTPNYRHAVHLHTGTCEHPGAHWNQGSSDNFCESVNLGEIWARPKAGDVGNINTDAAGNGSLIVESEFWSIGSGDERDLLGAIVVIHQDPENFDRECFESHMHTHANPKIACGAIEAF